MKTKSKAILAGIAMGAFGQIASADDIKVGLLLPYSGVYAAVGQEIDDAFTLGLEMYAGEVPDVNFILVREDDEVNPPVGMAKTRKLVLQDNVDVIAGVVSSGVLGAIRDFVHGSRVPVVVANAGNDEATGEQCSPYIVRLSFSNSQVNRPMGQWMYDQGIRKVYTLAPDYAAGRQMISAFANAFTAAGGEIVGQDFSAFRQTQDYGPYLTNARASGAEAIFAFYASSEAIAFVRQYDSFGLKDSVPLYGSGFLTSPLDVGAQGAAAEGVITSLHYVPTLDNEANRAFVEAFHAKSGRMPSEYAVHGFDSARALVEAVKAGASDRESLAAALSKVSFVGPRGLLSIDPATNNLIQTIYVYETVAGENGPTQKVLAAIPDQQDPPNGCDLG